MLLASARTIPSAQTHVRMSDSAIKIAILHDPVKWRNPKFPKYPKPSVRNRLGATAMQVKDSLTLLTAKQRPDIEGMLRDSPKFLGVAVARFQYFLRAEVEVDGKAKTVFGSDALKEKWAAVQEELDVAKPPTVATMSPFLLFDWLVPEDLKERVKWAAEAMHESFEKKGSSMPKKRQKRQQGATMSADTARASDLAAAAFGLGAS